MFKRVCVLLVLGVASAAHAELDDAAKAKVAAERKALSDPDPKRFSKSIAAFERWDRQNAWPSNGVLFAGSSSIRMWMTRRDYPGLPVINRGFGGSQISDIMHYFDKVIAPYKPRVIVFYCGDNDLAKGKSAERVLMDYQAFVARVHDKVNPKAHVIFVPAKACPARWANWTTISRMNGMVRAWSGKDARLHYADTVPSMLGEDGKPMPKLFLKDMLHLNEDGYAAWNRVLSPILTKAMAATANP